MFNLYFINLSNILDLKNDPKNDRYDTFVFAPFLDRLALNFCYGLNLTQCKENPYFRKIKTLFFQRLGVKLNVEKIKYFYMNLIFMDRSEKSN